MKPYKEKKDQLRVTTEETLYNLHIFGGFPLAFSGVLTGLKLTDEQKISPNLPLTANVKISFNSLKPSKAFISSITLSDAAFSCERPNNKPLKNPLNGRKFKILSDLPLHQVHWVDIDPDHPTILKLWMLNHKIEFMEPRGSTLTRFFSISRGKKDQPSDNNISNGQIDFNGQDSSNGQIGKKLTRKSSTGRLGLSLIRGVTLKRKTLKEKVDNEKSVSKLTLLKKKANKPRQTTGKFKQEFSNERVSVERVKSHKRMRKQLSPGESFSSIQIVDAKLERFSETLKRIREQMHIDPNVEMNSVVIHFATAEEAELWLEGILKEMAFFADTLVYEAKNHEHSEAAELLYRKAVDMMTLAKGVRCVDVWAVRARLAGCLYNRITSESDIEEVKLWNSLAKPLEDHDGNLIKLVKEAKQENCPDIDTYWARIALCKFLNQDPRAKTELFPADLDEKGQISLALRLEAEFGSVPENFHLLLALEEETKLSEARRKAFYVINDVDV